MIQNSRRPISTVRLVERIAARTKRPMKRDKRDTPAQRRKASVVVTIVPMKQNSEAISQ